MPRPRDLGGTQAQPTRRIDEIIVGKRYRKDMGDIDALAANIAKLGLQQPISIWPDGTLISGQRRILAYQHLGRSEIPVYIVTTASVEEGEFAENVFRKDFAPSELVAIGCEVERVESERAKERMVAAHASPGNLPEQDKGDARDKIAAQLGISGRTFEKARRRRGRRGGPEVRQACRRHGSDRPRRWRVQAAQDCRAGQANPSRAAAAAGQWPLSRRRCRFSLAV
jgi:ParB-like chromosome segregation protein Spo0J